MNSLSLRKLFLGLALVGAVLATGQIAWAANVWTGSTNSSITTPGNWNPAAVPTTTIEASFTEFGPNDGLGTNLVNVDGLFSSRYLDFYPSNGTIGTINATPGVIPNYLFSGTGTINIATNGGIDTLYGQTGTVTFSNTSVITNGAGYIGASFGGGSSNLVIDSTNFTIGNGTGAGSVVTWYAVGGNILVNPTVNWGTSVNRTATMNVQNNHTITLMNGINATSSTNRLSLSVGDGTANQSGRVIIDKSPGTWAGNININNVDLQINNGSALGTGVGYTQINATTGALILNNGATTNSGETIYTNSRLTNASAHIKNMPGSGTTTVAGMITGVYLTPFTNTNFNFEAAGTGNDLIVLAGGFTDYLPALQSVINLKGTGNGLVSGPLLIDASANAGATFSVRKLDGGIWTLSGSNNYNGTTNISAGTLNFAPSVAQTLTGLVTVADSAALGAKAFSTSSTALTAGTVNVGTASGGSILNIGLAGVQTVAPLTVTNLNTVGSPNTNIINITTAGPLSVGTIPLVDYSGSIGGSGYDFTLGSLPTRVLGTLNNNTGTTTIELNVSGTDTIRWNGTLNNTWAPSAVDFAGNWKTVIGNANTTYIETSPPGDIVTFDDNATGNYGISITSAVTPGSATFNANNSGHDYSFSGAGFSTPIFNMIGSQNVSFTNTNIAVTSTFNQSGGILTIANTGTLSLPTINLTGGTLNLARIDAYSLSSNITGGGTLNKAGSGTATLSGNNSGLTGPINVNNGVLKAGSNTALGSASSTVTVNGGTLDLNAKDLGNKVVSIAGSGVGGVGAINDSAATGISHLKGVVMTADATIGVTGGSSILIDNNNLGGASFTGGSNNLTINLGGTGGVAFTGVGDMGTNNVTVIGVSNSLGIGGNMSLGATGNLYLGSGATPGWLSINGSGIPEALTVPLAKPIIVPSGLNSIINTWFGNVQIDSTINNGGNLELAMYPRTAARTLTMTGAITGGTLCMHSSGTVNLATLNSTIALTNDSNTFGDVIVGGGGGYLGTLANADYMTLSVGNGSSTGSLGTGNVNLVGTGSGVPRLLFNKTGAYTVTNNIITSGIDNRAVVTTGSATGDVTLTGTISGPGTVQPTTGVMTLTGTNNYTGFTTLFGNSTLKISNNSALGATGNTTAGYTDIQPGAATSALSLLGGIDSGEFIWLGGRTGFAAPQIINGSGNNALSGTLALYIGGNRSFALESVGTANSDLLRVTGSLRTPSTGDGANSLGGASNVSLQGTGNGLVSGVISEGTINTLQVINIEKNGGGTWTLSGVNTYTGTTNINTGKLALSGSGTINTSSVIAVASGATFDVTGSGGYTLGSNQTLKGTGAVFGNITMSSANSQIAPGMSPGTLNITGDLNTSGGTLNYELTHSPMGVNDLINVTGNINASAPTNVNIVALDTFLDNGSFPLITYTGTLTGGSPNFALVGVSFTGTRRHGTINTTINHQINLDVTGGPLSIIWAGGLNSNAWDLINTVNWTGAADSDNRFYNQDSVTFSNAGSNSPNINVVDDVAPTDFNFTNSAAHDYTFSGSKNIAATGNLTATGSGNTTFTIPSVSVAGSMNLGGGGKLTANGSNFTITGNINVNDGSTLSVATGNLTTSQANTVYATRSKINIATTSSSATLSQSNGTTITTRDLLAGIGSGSNATLNLTGGTLNVTGDAAGAGGLVVAANGGSANVTQGASTVTAAGRIYIGSDGSNASYTTTGAHGSWVQTDPAAVLSAGSWIDIGTGNGNVGSLTVAGNVTATVFMNIATSSLTAGDNSHGTLNVLSTGTVNVTRTMWVGQVDTGLTALGEITNAGVISMNNHLVLGDVAGTAHFINQGSLIVGNGLSGNTSSTINNATNVNFGEIGLGIYGTGALGTFDNLGSATVLTDGIRLGDNYLAYNNTFGPGGGQGTFNQDSSGAVTIVRNGTDNTNGRGGNLIIGEGLGGVGVFNHTGSGTVQVQRSLILGTDNSVGTYNLTPTSTATLNVGGDLFIGQTTGVGIFNLSPGGTVNVGSRFAVGDNGGSFGILTQTGGDINILTAAGGYIGWVGNGEYDLSDGNFNSNSYLLVGQLSNGVLNQTGGTVNVTGAGTYVVLGNLAGGTGLYDLSGFGTLLSTDLYVGNQGQGTLNQSDGSINSTNQVSIGHSFGGDGVYNLSASGYMTTETLLVGFAGHGGLNQTGGYIVTTSVGIGETDGTNQGTGVHELYDGTLIANGGIWVGDAGFGTLNIYGGGSANVSAGLIHVGEVSGANGLVNMDGGTVNVAGELFVGNQGTGVFNHTAGHLTVNDYASIGEGGAGVGTYNISGTANLEVAVYLLVGDGGHGEVNQTGGAVTVYYQAAIGESAAGGVYTMSAGSLDVADTLYAGDAGAGAMNVSGSATINTGNLYIGTVDVGTMNVTGSATVNASNLIHVGEVGGSTGTLNVTGGAIYSVNNIAAGYFGNGTIEHSNGAITTDRNFVVAQQVDSNGFYHLSGTGTLNLTGASTPNAGNLTVARNSTGTMNVDGGIINLTSATANTNSVRYAFTTLDPLSIQDGNLIVGENAAGNGVVNQTGGTINVAANVSVGLNGTGVYDQSNGIVNVGLHGGTGGDVVVGGLSGSNGTYNLSGGTLNVTTGSGSIALGLGSGSFTFSGGTLKVLDFNDTATFVGNLGGLVQNGPTSLLDVTGNNTTIHGTYNLKDGTVNTGSTRTTTVTGALAADGTGAKTALVTGAGTLNANGLAVLGGGELTKTGAGTLRISGAQSNGANSTLNASGGTTILNSDAGSVGNLNLNVITSGPTTVATLNSTEHVASINASGGSKVELTTSGALYTPGNKYAHTGSLSIDATSTVDIGNGALIVNYTGNASPYAAVLADVMGSFNGGYWDLPGLTSSAAAADVFVGGITTLGVVDNADLAYDSISGSQFSYDAVGNVPANSVLVKFTYYGDSDLNGEVTADDLTNFFYGFDGLGPASWVYGDFDYSGEVTADDLTIWALGFDNQAGTLSAGGGPVELLSSGSGPVAVPEPSSILLLILGALGLAWRKTRGKTVR